VGEQGGQAAADPGVGAKDGGASQQPRGIADGERVGGDGGHDGHAVAWADSGFLERHGQPDDEAPELQSAELPARVLDHHAVGPGVGASKDLLDGRHVVHEAFLLRWIR